MEAVIVIIMVIVLVKLGKVLFGEDERHYDCAVCENYYGGNQVGGPCEDCKNGSKFERRDDIL